MRIPFTRAATCIAFLSFVAACSSSSNSTSTSVASIEVTTASTSPASTNGASTSSASKNPASTSPTSSTPAVTAATTAPSTTVASVQTAAGGVDPNAPEVVEPGDIPDNQVFIPYAATNGLYTIKVPEGWARTDAGGIVTFTDNYNTIAVQSSSATAAPTVESVTASGLTDVSSDPTFRLVKIEPVRRKAGDGVIARYEIGSTPNPVTGKKALLAVERYFFFHNGTSVVLTLSGAKGADNVDPWRIVSDSLAWT